MDSNEPGRIAALAKKFREGTLSSEEADELQRWRDASLLNDKLFEERMTEAFAMEGMAILREAEEAMQEDFTRVTQRKYTVRMRPKWRFYSAAAAVVLVAATGLLYYLFRTDTPFQPASIAGKAVKLMPGGNKAVLYLDDGRTIVLDSAANGVLAQQGGTSVQKLGSGQLAYVIGGRQNAETRFNRIETPAGGQYRVVLPDGSKVWLNDLSSLRFPTAFATAERVVELTGEAYFEVAKNPLKPFKVQTGNTVVTVLGTHFNVNAYGDEKVVATTLLEGLVRVTIPGRTAIITPGQEARSGAGLAVVDHADTSAVTAWKDGYFEFTDADIRAVMRQLSRWYDIDVHYAEKLPAELVSGRISRNNVANDVLTVLEASGYHFKIDGKSITVLP